jgi:hypothetical protein
VKPGLMGACDVRGVRRARLLKNLQFYKYSTTCTFSDAVCQQEQPTHQRPISPNSAINIISIHFRWSLEDI